MTPHLLTPTLPPGFLLRRMRPADTGTTARLHRRLLPNGLFPRLGQQFLRRWHGTFLDTPAATGLVVVHSGEVVAFVLATLDQRLYLHHVLRRHRWALMWRGALGLLGRPAVLVRFLRTRVPSYARRLAPGARPDVACEAAPTAPAATPEGTRPQRHVRVAVVHAVVTSEHARGKGCARALLDAVTSAARQARADHLALVTDVAEPTDSGAASGESAKDEAATGEAATGEAATGAAGMYEALGWERVDVRRHRDGRWVAEYRFALAAGSEATGSEATAVPTTARLERSA